MLLDSDKKSANIASHIFGDTFFYFVPHARRKCEIAIFRLVTLCILTRSNKLSYGVLYLINVYLFFFFLKTQIPIVSDGTRLIRFIASVTNKTGYNGEG